MIVFRKDWREIRRNWQVIMPVVVIPIIFAIFLPVVLGSGFNTSSASGQHTNMTAFTKGLQPSVSQEIDGLPDNQAVSYIMLLYFFAPFILIIPLMASSVISSDSFAGEKERKTTEALLATPLTDSELFLAKVLVAFIPAIIATVVSFIMYSVVVDAMFFPALGRLVLPNLNWVLLVFLLAPALALIGIGISVIVSSRVKGFREAQQISGVLVLPVLLLLFAQMSGVLFLGPFVITLLALVFFAIDAVIFRFGIKIFNREELLSKLG